MACMLLRDFAYAYSVRNGIKCGQLPDFGHLDVQLEQKIQFLSVKVFGHSGREYKTWTVGDLNHDCDWSPTGVQPSSVDAFALYDESKLDCSQMPPSLRYLAKESKLLAPVLPVATSKEVRLYVTLLGEIGRTPNFERMAALWKSHVNGNDVFPKLPCHLRSFYERWQAVCDKAKM